MAFGAKVPNLSSIETNSICSFVLLLLLISLLLVLIVRHRWFTKETFGNTSVKDNLIYLQVTQQVALHLDICINGRRQVIGFDFS